jgi:hypothetical protein
MHNAHNAKPDNNATHFTHNKFLKNINPFIRVGYWVEVAVEM